MTTVRWFRKRQREARFEEQVAEVEARLPVIAEQLGVSVEEARRMWWAPFPSIKRSDD